MRTFIVIFLALHIPLFVYPVLRLSGWLDVDGWITMLILVPVAASQIISRWLLRDAKHGLARLVRYLADFILGLSPILLLTLLVAELLVFLQLVTSPVAALGTLLTALIIALIGLAAAMLPFVRRISFASPHLRDPVRFVQITDVHVGSRSKRFLDQIIARVKKLDPEFLCITGDFIDATGVPVGHLAALSELRCPIYFSIGNHERYEDLDEIIVRLESFGVQVLRTASVMHRADLQVMGIDDREDALRVERELAKLPARADAFSLLLYHRPKGLEAAARSGVDLMISGHTHNGQIFPFNLVVNQVFDKTAGLYHHNESRLYVSQGTGTWGPVMRVGTRAEITLFELEPEDRSHHVT